MTPISQLDRIERTLNAMDSKLDKVDRICAVHGTKIAANAEAIRGVQSKLWSVLVLCIGGLVTAAFAAITGSQK